MIDGPIWPRSFARQSHIEPVDPYLSEPAAQKLAEFFYAKGLAALKDEDGREVWYQDWLDYQAKHRLYASVLSPKQYSSFGGEFDLLKLVRFLEVFAYFSPGHGYSLQVTFLGLFSILMGSNDGLKREAVEALEAGGLFALGVSEKEHGSDLLANEFSVTEVAGGADEFIGNGRKYYIGNANCAAMVSILTRKHSAGEARPAGQQRRAPFALLALRPAKAPGYQNVRKIRTLGVRAAFVGEFEVKDHAFPATDFIAEGREAWEAVLGTVTLGKFFLGFGSIGICEHAMEEAVAHMRGRMLYRKSVLDMPHIRLAASQAYARLVAMKLYAYRALDYVQSASQTDRRYLLYCAVQKTKVSTEGVKVISQLSECIGAKGFESQTYFESALRDIQLIPGLEGSTHINLAQTAQFIEQYFKRPTRLRPEKGGPKGSNARPGPRGPGSLSRGDVPPTENPYLMQARGGSINDIAFAHFFDAYRPLKNVPNVRRFVRQVKAFGMLIRKSGHKTGTDATDTRITFSLAQCMATIAYAQLIAENAALFGVEAPMVSAIFHLLVTDLSAAGMVLAGLPDLDLPTRALARKMIAIPSTAGSDWDDVAGRLSSMEVG